MPGREKQILREQLKRKLNLIWKKLKEKQRKPEIRKWKRIVTKRKSEIINFKLVYI